MRGFAEKTLNSIKEYFSNLTRKEKIRFALLAASVVVLSIVAAYLLGRTNYVVLYSGLDTAKAGEARAAVEEMGYTVKSDGTGTLLVPEGTEDEIKQRMAANGFESVQFNYDLLNSASGFGMTDEVTKQYITAQAQDHLKTVIKSYVMVKDCHVLINPAETSTFVRPRGENEASVSVQLILEDGMELDNAGATSIAKGVMASLKGLTLENITITDQYAHYYQLGDVENDPSADPYTRLQLEQQLAYRHENTLRSLLAPMLGMDNFRVVVNPQLTMDEESISSVEYAPPVEGMTEGIVVSMSELYEKTRGDAAVYGVPGTDENGMNTVTYPELGEELDDYYYKLARDTNYEINETHTMITKEMGRVVSINAGVTLNSNVLSEDYVALVQDLVSRTLGVPTGNISVQIAPFQPVETAELVDPGSMTGADVRKIIETVINAVVVLLLAFAMFGLIRTIYKGSRPQAVLADGTGMNVDYIADDELGEDEDIFPEIEIKQKTEGIVQLENFIDKDAEAVAMLLRNWLTED